MGVINNAFNKAGWSILQLASATARYREQRNEEAKNKAKQSYNTFATIKKQNNDLTQNNELTQNQTKTPKSYFDIKSINSILSSEIDEQKVATKKVLEQFAQERAKATSSGKLAGVEEAPAPKQVKATSFGEIPTAYEMDEQKIAEQKALEKMAEEKTKAASFDELPTVSAEHSETNINAKDPEVQGLIQVKQKNALRAAASQRSQKRYQDIKAKLTGVFADEHNIDDVWRNISLAPDITDEMIRKAGFTKTKILEEWKHYKDWPEDWITKMNIRGEEYGIGGGIAEAEEGENFGRLLSAYIKAKAGGKTLAQQQEEYELSKAEEEPSVDDWYLNFDRNNNTMSNSDNYKVWQDESTEEEKDEVKTDRNFSGFIWQDEFTKKESTEEKKDEEKKDEVKTDRDFSGFKF